MKFLLLQLIRAYQFLASPWIGGACRFVPSCSAYAAEAIERHGAAAGSLLAAARLARCHPLGGAGWDPVPEHPPLGALRRVLRGATRPPAPPSGCDCAGPGRPSSSASAPPTGGGAPAGS